MNLNETESSRILSRVRKMLRLAEDAGATEGERDNALRMAHATLAKYNLDLASVEAEVTATDEPRDQSKHEALGKAWTRGVAASIGRLYFCVYYFTPLTPNGSRVRHCFAGRRSNAVLAGEIALFVIGAIHKEAERFRRVQGTGYVSYRAFAQGAAARVAERCREIRASAERQPVAVLPKVPGTALTLTSLYGRELEANNRYLASVGLRFRSGRGAPTAQDAAAHAAGRNFGGSIALQKQIR